MSLKCCEKQELPTEYQTLPKMKNLKLIIRKKHLQTQYQTGLEVIFKSIPRYKKIYRTVCFLCR